MKHEPDIFDHIDLEADAASHARGIADLDAGRVISHKAMREWLLAWGRGERRPMPKIGD